jgi:hypothetical protein
MNHTPSPPSLPQPSASSVPLHFAGRELGAISLFTGIPFSRAPWEKQRGQNSSTMLMHLQSPNAFDLPDRSLLELNFEVYCTSLMQRIFPVVDPVLFWTTINSAYKQHASGADSAHVSSTACIFAFAAFVSILCYPCFLQQGREIPRFDEDACVAKTRYLLCQVLQEPPTLEGLQAVTMLVCFSSPSHLGLHNHPNLRN